MSGIANFQRTERQRKDPFFSLSEFPRNAKGFRNPNPIDAQWQGGADMGNAPRANVQGAQVVRFGLAQLCRPHLRRLAMSSAQPGAPLPICIPSGSSAANAMLQCRTSPRCYGLSQLCRPHLHRLAVSSAQPGSPLPVCIPPGSSAAGVMLWCRTSPSCY